MTRSNLTSTSTPAFPPAAVIQASGHPVSTELTGEAVILDPVGGSYYSLGGVGALVWRLLQAPRSFQDLQDAVLAAYQVEADRCRHDLQQLLEELQAAGLIEVRHEETS